MEYLVPLAIVLVIVIAVVVASRFMGRKGRALQDAEGPRPRTAKPTPRRPRATREMAEEASARLTPEAHRAVYSLIARQQVLNAVQAYRKATRSSLGQAAAAVAALAEFPQPSPDPVADGQPFADEDILEPGPESAVPKPAGAEPAGAEPAEPATAGPEPVAPKPAVAAGTYRYRAIVSRGDEVREVASTRLNEEIFGRIRSLALSGDLDGAARLLRGHADVSDGDAREFVSMIGPVD
ncbi:hypothetical protein [Arthrobacter dokdonensis]|uniref:hypothetical protein n=1 Tax=Arthrobacter dokdonellae TaxID=2211210 RepID=UPI0014943D7C|nr:hypothetical protein [Arthrobacter dokdonellae]